MGYWNTQVYAVSGLELCIADITRTFTGHIVSSFPHGTFKEGSVYVDTMGLINDHKRRETGLENPKKVTKPFMTVNINNGTSDQWNIDDNGPNVKQFSMFPGTTTDRRLVNGHRLGMIVDEITGIRVDTVEIRRKIELGFKIEFDSKADLNTFKSYMYNTLPFKKNNYLHNVKTNVILPNSLINDMIKLSFDKSTFDYKNQTDIDKFTKYLNDNGLFYFHQKFEDVNRDNIWYTMDRIMKVNYYMNEMESKDGDGSDKNSESFGSFSLEFTVTIDFKLPNSYVLNYKVFNAPNKSIVGNTYFNNVNPNIFCNTPVSFNEAKYIETREVILPPPGRYFQTIRVEEFFVENPVETIQVSAFIDYTSIFWLILERATIKERVDIFSIHLYEGDTLVEKSAITFEDCGSDMVYHVSQCNPKISYMIVLYCDMLKFMKILPKLIERVIKDIYPHYPLIIGSYPPVVGDYPPEDRKKDIDKLKELTPDEVVKYVKDKLGEEIKDIPKGITREPFDAGSKTDDRKEFYRDEPTGHIQSWGASITGKRG